MSNTYYNIYLKSVFSLAKTLVIKCSLTADGMNNELRLNGIPIDDSDPTTWKYYKNLAGMYHFTDTLMEIVSMDTLEVIAFTKENMRLHRATAKAYAYGTKYFNELSAQYPGQEDLIMGILNPVDMDVAIAAR